MVYDDQFLCSVELCPIQFSCMIYKLLHIIKINLVCTSDRSSLLVSEGKEEEIKIAS